MDSEKNEQTVFLATDVTKSMLMWIYFCHRCLTLFYTTLLLFHDPQMLQAQWPSRQNVVKRPVVGEEHLWSERGTRRPGKACLIAASVNRLAPS